MTTSRAGSQFFDSVLTDANGIYREGFKNWEMPRKRPTFESGSAGTEAAQPERLSDGGGSQKECLSDAGRTNFRITSGIPTKTPKKSTKKSKIEAIVKELFQQHPTWKELTTFALLDKIAKMRVEGFEQVTTSEAQRAAISEVIRELREAQGIPPPTQKLSDELFGKFFRKSPAFRGASYQKVVAEIREQGDERSLELLNRLPERTLQQAFRQWQREERSSPLTRPNPDSASQSTMPPLSLPSLPAAAPFLDGLPSFEEMLQTMGPLDALFSEPPGDFLKSFD